LKVFKRRTLLIPGEFLMAITMGLVGLASFYSYNIAVMILLVVFLFFY
jgi:hypothetical protein